MKFIKTIQKYFSTFPVFVGLIIFLIFLMVNVIIYYLTPDGWVYTGFLQSDHTTYTAIARDVFENGNGFFYAAPYSIIDNGPRIYFQLPFFIVAWIWKLTNLGFPSVWQIFSLIFTLLTICIIYEFIGIFVKEDFWRKWMLVLLCTGGGIAWLFSIIKILVNYVIKPSINTGYFDALSNIESSYKWWGIDLFRNFGISIETIYHFMLFLTLTLALKRKYFSMAIGFFLTWLSGVFVGIEISAILLTFFLIEYFLSKNKKLIYPFVSLFLITLLFYSYYNIFITHFPEGRSLNEQHKHFPQMFIPAHSYIPAYGFPLFLFLAAVLDKKFIKGFLQEQKNRLLLLMVITVFSLNINHLIIPRGGIQPAHFTRGYLFFSMLLIGLLWLKSKFHYMQISEFNIRKKLLLVLLIPIFFIDNALFLIDVSTKPRHPNILTIQKETKELLDYLNSIKSSKHIISTNRQLGIIIPTHTIHKTLLADLIITPFNGEKTEDAQKYFQFGSKTNVLKKYNINLIIVDKGYNNYFQKYIKDENTKEIFQNSLWVVYDYSIK